MTNPDKKNPVGIVLRGIAMGAADVVPGVSGGTIAFITGIYEELLETISNLNFGLFKTWREDGFKTMWIKGNFTFLFSLFLGIGISIASLAVLIEHLLKTHPIQLWGFFFGLIIASVWLVGKSVEKWDTIKVLALLAGTISAYFITIMAPSQESSNLFYIFLCGAVAICAMILPGISGSFILLLMGAYASVLGAVSGILSGLKESNWEIVLSNGTLITVFMVGCLVGLISFSKLLNWLFKKAHDITIAILTGFLIGSLNKIWPWKEIHTVYYKHKGEINEEIVPLVQKNISPSAYPKATQNFNDIYEQSVPTENGLASAIILALLGVVLIVLLDRFGKKRKTKINTKL